VRGNMHAQFLEGWAPAMGSDYSVEPGDFVNQRIDDNAKAFAGLRIAAGTLFLIFGQYKVWAVSASDG
jgi:hypothetical protein